MEPTVVVVVVVLTVFPLLFFCTISIALTKTGEGIWGWGGGGRGGVEKGGRLCVGERKRAQPSCAFFWVVKGEGSHEEI